MDADRGYVEPVIRIFFFADVVGQIFDPDRLHETVVKSDGYVGVAVVDFSDRRCDGDDAHRQQLLPEQSVDQGAFAALKLADYRDVDAFGFQFF